MHHVVQLPAIRAATALLLCAPQTPLLFMGQEWGASAPFLFFTDHGGPLGELVRQGRAREFDRFASFVAAGDSGGIPDPQAVETFDRSKLDWGERRLPPHAQLLRLHRDLLKVRRTEAAFAPASQTAGVHVAPPDTIVLTRSAADGSTLLLAARLRGEGEVVLPVELGGTEAAWASVLDTEDVAYAPDPQPIEVAAADVVRVTFRRPGAVLLKRRQAT